MGVCECQFFGNACIPQILGCGFFQRKDLFAVLVCELIVIQQRYRLGRVPYQRIYGCILVSDEFVFFTGFCQDKVVFDVFRCARGRDIGRNDLEAYVFVSVAVLVLLGFLLETEGHGIGFAGLFEFLVERLVGNSREDQLAFLGLYIAFVGDGCGFGCTGLDLFGNERNCDLPVVDLPGERFGERCGCYAESDLHFGGRSQRNVVGCFGASDVRTAEVYVIIGSDLRRDEYDRLDAAGEVVDGAPNGRDLFVVFGEYGCQIVGFQVCGVAGRAVVGTVVGNQTDDLLFQLRVGGVEGGDGCIAYLTGPYGLIACDVLGHVLGEARTDHFRDGLADSIDFFVVVDRFDDLLFDGGQVGIAYARVDFADFGIDQLLNFFLHLLRPDIGEGELCLDQFVDGGLVERIVADQVQNLFFSFVTELFYLFDQFAARYVAGQFGIQLGVGDKCREIDILQFVGDRLKGRSVGLQLDFAFQVVDLTFQVVDVVVVILTADGTEQCSGQKHCQKFSEQVVFHSTKD